MEDKLMESVARAGAKAGREATEKAKEGIKAWDKLNSKPKSGKYKKKVVLTIGEMKTTTLYIGLDDKIVYRKVGGELQMLESGKWRPVQVTAGFLQEMKFREY